MNVTVSVNNYPIYRSLLRRTLFFSAKMILLVTAEVRIVVMVVDSRKGTGKCCASLVIGRVSISTMVP